MKAILCEVSPFFNWWEGVDVRGTYGASSFRDLSLGSYSMPN